MRTTIRQSMNLPISTACVAVAFSGGHDSTALLHATVAAARPLGIAVVALHVHHGLSAHADAWLARCESFCKELAASGADLRFVAARVKTRPLRGDSVEAWARMARYDALRAMALDHGTSVVLLAHHRRDQAETLLLQALRGAGPAGLAGMPRSIERDGVEWIRPWLYRSREQIEAYVTRHKLAFSNDESNDDLRLARNRLRVAVWPALLAAFPDAEASLASSAQWAHEATLCMAELAAMDLPKSNHDSALDLAAWRSLSSARRSNVLRTWLRGRSGRAASMSLVTRLMDELATNRPARWPLAKGELRSHRGWLRHVAETTVDASAAATRAAPRGEVTLHVTRAGMRRLPAWQGALCFERVAGGGIALDRLQTLVIRPRGGQEQFQSGPGRPPRALKKQFQALGVSAWDRGGPLVFIGDDLVFVPGLGIDHRAVAPLGAPQMALSWVAGN